MSMPTYAGVTLNSWSDFKSFIEELSDNWAFRGQGDNTWELMNAIERTDFIHLYKGVETEFLAEFQRGARNYLTNDDLPSHLIEWLALMQHHGAPTRLLDFSKSPFIAAFFAFEQCLFINDNSIAIWAINIDYLKQRAAEAIQQFYPQQLKDSNNVVSEQLFETIFFDNRHSFIFPVEPFRMNRRYSLQQSIFISTANSYEPFMQQLSFIGNDLNKAVVKIELPAKLQKEVIRDLQRMNLNRASLFPDLDGYAASLRLRYNSLQTPEEIEAARLQQLENNRFRFLPWMWADYFNMGKTAASDLLIVRNLFFCCNY